MNNYIINSYKNLSLVQKIEYSALLLLAFLIPISWLWASRATLLLVVAMVAKLIVEEKNHIIRKKEPRQKLFLFFCISYILYAISMIYTSNTDVGLQNLEKKLSFIVFPLFFLVANLSYLTQNRIHIILYSFVVGLFAFVFINLSWATYDYIFLNAPIGRFIGWEVTKLAYIHHTYVAMYSCLAIVFCFFKIFEQPNIFNLKTVLLSIAIIFFILFIILVESRAGILCMGLLFFFLLLWILIYKKSFRTMLSVGGIVVGVIIISCLVFPSGLNRLIKTQQALSDSEQKEDIRITLLKAGTNVAKENWICGVGVGDRCDVLENYYIENNLDCGTLNSHNQFIDTTISIGVLGLLALLSYFILPIVLFIKERKWNFTLLLFLFIIGFNAVFEAVFESQTGIIFFNFIYCILFFYSFVQKMEDDTAR